MERETSEASTRLAGGTGAGGVSFQLRSLGRVERELEGDMVQCEGVCQDRVGYISRSAALSNLGPVIQGQDPASELCELMFRPFILMWNNYLQRLSLRKRRRGSARALPHNAGTVACRDSV